MKVVGEALRNEEEIVAMQVGAAPLAQKPGDEVGTAGKNLIPHR